MTSERTLIFHGIAKCPSWYWSSAVQLEMFLNLPCRLRQRMANSANSSSKQMQMNATYMAGRISSHVFQNVYMNSKHVSFFYTHGAWKVVLASGAFQTLRPPMTAPCMQRTKAPQFKSLIIKELMLWNGDFMFLLFVPFPVNCQSLQLQPQKVYAANNCLNVWFLV